MQFRIRLVAVVFVALLFCSMSLRADESIPAALQDYVRKPDDSFAWKLIGKSEQPLGAIYDIELTSQTWQGLVWKHVLMVYEPKALRHGEQALLFILSLIHI